MKDAAAFSILRSMIRITIEGFLDGQRVQRELLEPSRWEIQEAERVKIEIRGDRALSSSPSSLLSIDLAQLPRCLSSSKVGVGAVLWDGGIVLTALLATLPPAALLGEVVVELGAGVGAPSLAAAKRGARVISTDKEAAVRGVLQQNVERNKLLCPSCRLPPDAGEVALATLEFGTKKGDAAAAALADAVAVVPSSSLPSSSSAAAPSDSAVSDKAERGIDLVLAADCVYSDGDGDSPDPEALCRAAARLLMCRRRRDCRGGERKRKGEGGEGGEEIFLSPPPSSSRFWLASEERDAETHALFERAAARHFASVRRLQLPAEVFKDGSKWGHVRVFELSGAASGTESGRSLSAAEMRALRKLWKRGWP